MLTIHTPRNKCPDFLTTADSLIHQTQASITNAPAGSLNIKHHKGSVQYYQRIPGPRVKYIYLSKNQIDLIRALAQKDYSRQALPVLQKQTSEARQLYTLIHSDPADSSADPVLFSGLFQALDEVYEKLSPERQALITPVVPTTKQYVKAWLSEPCEHMGFRETDNTRFYSKGLGRVRSKSELYIADQFYYRRYPAKYECPLRLGDITLHPDFTVLDTHTRCEVYFEHCGMLGDPGYSDKFLKKMGLYEAHDIFSGKGLLITRESATMPFDTRSFDRLLENHLRKPLEW